MPRDLFEEAGIKPIRSNGPRDLFEEAGVRPKKTNSYDPDAISTKRMLEQGIKSGKSFRRGLKNFGIGTIDLIPGVNVPREASPEGLSGQEKAAEMAGEISPMLIPTGWGLGVTKIASKIPGAARALKALTTPAGKAISGGALFGAIENPEDQLTGAAIGAGTGGLFHGAGKLIGTENPFIQGAITGGIGAGAGYKLGGEHGAEAGGTIGAALPFYSRTSARALKNAFKGVKTGNIEEKMAASERLGVPLTPAETGSIPAAEVQGGAGTSEEGSKNLTEFGEERLGKEKTAINKFLDAIHPEAKTRREKELYGIAHEKQITKERLDKLLESKTISKALNDVKTTPTYIDELGNAPDNSVKTLDLIKRNIDGKISVAKRAGDYDEVRMLRNHKSEVIKAADEVSPEYKEARRIANRRIIRRNIEKKVNKEALSGTTFYKKLLEKDANFNELHEKLGNIPEAQQSIKDMRLIFKDLIPKQTVKGAAQRAKASTNTPKNRNFLDRVTVGIDNLFGGKYDKEVTSIITDPKWYDNLKSISMEKDKMKKSDKFLNLLSKVTIEKEIEAKRKKQ